MLGEWKKDYMQKGLTPLPSHPLTPHKKYKLKIVVV